MKAKKTEFSISLEKSIRNGFKNIEDFSKKSGISSNTLQNYFTRGVPKNILIFLKIAENLNISVEELVTGKESEEINNENKKLIDRINKHPDEIQSLIYYVFHRLLDDYFKKVTPEKAEAIEAGIDKNKILRKVIDYCLEEITKAG